MIVQIAILIPVFYLAIPASKIISENDIQIKTDNGDKVKPGELYSITTTKNGRTVDSQIVKGEDLIKKERGNTQGFTTLIPSIISAILVVGGIGISAKILSPYEEAHANKITKTIKIRLIIKIIHAVAGLSFFIGAIMTIMFVFAMQIDDKNLVVPLIITIIIFEFLAIFGLHFYQALIPYFSRHK